MNFKQTPQSRLGAKTVTSYQFANADRLEREDAI